MLPSAPKTLGRLSDVLKSVMTSTRGAKNPLQLSPVESAIVLMVDGLGAHNLRQGAGHARFLNSALLVNKPSSTVFPTTTAAALTSFATGTLPSEHGFVGYRVFDRERARVQNLLSGWDSFEASDGWRNGIPLSESDSSVGLTLSFVGPAAYSSSGFTNVMMPSATYVSAQTIEDRVSKAIEIASKPKQVVYLYVPELDQLAHSLGVNSYQWLELLERLDSEVAKLSGRISKKTGLIVTADHGIVDVRPESQIELSELELPQLKFVGGDTRAAFVYLQSDSDAAVAKVALQEQLGATCWVAGLDELIEAGWVSSPRVAATARYPEVFVLAKKAVAVYHREFSSPKSYNMVGHHGSITPEELSIPLLKLGAWA